jgi:SAM-dependent methyltransferase
MTYVRKQCLFCHEREQIDELYPQTFRIEDLTAEVFSARRSTEHYHYTMVRCRNCGLVFSRDILSEDALTQLYSKSKVTFSKYSDIIAKDYWRCLEHHVNRIEKSTALEIGCSSGFFLEELLSNGFKEVFGCEPSVEAKEMAPFTVRKNITLGFFKPGLYPPGKFDLVCSFQTLDHLDNPVEALHETHRILKPGGLAFFITHNVDALGARLLGEKSPIIDVEHIYLFSKKTITRLLDESGFEVIQVSDVKNSYPIEYWLRMFPMPGTMRTILQKLFRGIGLAQRPLSIKAGNMFAIGRKRESP